MDRKSIDIKRISNIYRLNDDDDEDDYDADYDNKGVIELEKSEYVQVNNGCTSPLSMSDYYPNNSNGGFDDEDDEPLILHSTQAPISMSKQVKTPDELKEKYGNHSIAALNQFDQI